jgi:hypothetical protein
MRQIDIELFAVLSVVVLVNTVVLGVSLAIFRPGPTGHFANRGQLGGWLFCALLMSAMFVVQLLPVGILAPAVVWWILALQVLRLTIRQTIKLNIVFFLVYFGIMIGFGSAAL